MVYLSTCFSSTINSVKPLPEKALVNDTNNFGETDHIVASDQSNLALVLRDLGGEYNLGQAKSLLEKAIKSDISSLGETAPIIAIHQSNLAGILWALGGQKNIQAAKVLYIKALNNTIINFGKNHYKVAEVQSDLAVILLMLGERKYACQLLLEAYWIFRSFFNEGYEYTQAVLSMLSEHCPECVGWK